MGCVLMFNACSEKEEPDWNEEESNEKTEELDANGFGYIDLGLSSKTLWASCNIGAAKPEDCGDYFAWGEIVPKSEYGESTYRYCVGEEGYIKYCPNSSYGRLGYTDTLTELEPEDDAARMNWGGDWRIPTRAEWDELVNTCSWKWTEQDGVNGFKVMGPNGKSIFLPAAGCFLDDEHGLSLVGYIGNYWAREVTLSSPDRASILDIDSGSLLDEEPQYGTTIGFRFWGYSVRAVLKR